MSATTSPAGVDGGWEDRRRNLRAPHVAALNDQVERWTKEAPERPVPWFDPADGGVDATILLLLEAPGPRTLAAGGSGFCSEDNPDPTNAVVRSQRAAAGLPRSACVKWNAVPWPLSGPPRSAETTDAADKLRQVLEHLSQLRLVIVFGATALSVLGLASTLADPSLALPVLAVPHPSQRNTHAREQAQARLDRAFAYAVRIAGPAGRGG